MMIQRLRSVMVFGFAFLMLQGTASASQVYIPGECDPCTKPAPYATIDTYGWLRSTGWDDFSVEGLKRAVVSDDAGVRQMAIPALARTIGLDAAPLIRERLEDEDFWVRNMAAQALAELEDTDSLECMAALFERAVAEFAKAKMHQENSKDLAEWRGAVSEGKLATWNAFQVGEALARLGDSRALDFAARASFDGEPEGMRACAVDPLTTIIMKQCDGDEQVYQTALFVLRAAAESDESGAVFEKIAMCGRSLDFRYGAGELKQSLENREFAPKRLPTRETLLSDIARAEAEGRDPSDDQERLQQLDAYEAEVKARRPKSLLARTNRAYLGRVPIGESGTGTIEIRTPPRFGVTAIRLTPTEEHPSLKAEWDHPDATTYVITFRWTPGEGEGHLRAPFKVASLQEEKVLEEIDIFCYGLVGPPEEPGAVSEEHQPPATP